MAALGPAQPPGWLARLELGFAARAGRTVLAHRRHQGPLVVQRPFYPEGGVCHLYLLHPPGGIVGGDRLDLTLACEAGAHALITTPGAGKFYRSAGPLAVQRQHLRVAAGAALEWLPQEQIVFAGAAVDSLIRIELETGAGFIGWEISCLGRPASGETFSHGALRQRFELWRAGKPLLLERSRIDGGSDWLACRWGAGGQPVLGTLAAVGAGAQHVELARAAVADAANEVALTRLDEVLIARYLGPSAERARALLTRIWVALRPPLLGVAACEPRIWRT
jgi:urease accessory protein